MLVRYFLHCDLIDRIKARQDKIKMGRKPINQVKDHSAGSILGTQLVEI